MPKVLEIEIRNKDFGPIKSGKFFDAQIKCTQNFGVGDELFAPPRDRQSIDQFGFEDAIQPVVTVVFKDATTVQRKTEADKKTFPMPGKSQILLIELPENKAYHDILTVNLHFEGCEFGHSRSGGGGMSYSGKRELGSASMSGTKIPFQGKIHAAISLSDLWDLSIPREEISTARTEFIDIDFLQKAKDINDTEWQNVELVEDWRSQLAPYWSKNSAVKQEYNLHNSFSWVIPIKVFAPGKEGWVIGINDSSHITDATKQHADLYRKYAATPEYKAEEAAAREWYFNGPHFKPAPAASELPAAASDQLESKALRP